MHKAKTQPVKDSVPPPKKKERMHVKTQKLACLNRKFKNASATASGPCNILWWAINASNRFHSKSLGVDRRTSPRFSHINLAPSQDVLFLFKSM